MKRWMRYFGLCLVATITGGASAIGRRTCPEDRRKRVVYPKPKAKAVWEQGVNCARRVRERATRGFAPADRERLKRLLSDVLDNMRAPQRIETEVA